MDKLPNVPLVLELEQESQELLIDSRAWSDDAGAYTDPQMLVAVASFRRMHVSKHMRYRVPVNFSKHLLQPIAPIPTIEKVLCGSPISNQNVNIRGNYIS